METMGTPSGTGTFFLGFVEGDSTSVAPTTRTRLFNLLAGSSSQKRVDCKIASTCCTTNQHLRVG